MDRRDRKLFRNAYANIIELREGLTTKRGFLTRYEMVSDLLQSYGIVAFFDPVFAVERRLDVEIWDIVCKDTLQKCISSRRGRPHNRKFEFKCQIFLENILCRAYGFYYTLMHKLLGRLSKSTFTKNYQEISFSANTPVTCQVYCGGDYFDLDNVTLNQQLLRFTHKERESQRELAKLSIAIEKSKKRPTILRRGMALPTELTHSSQTEPQEPQKPQITLHQAIRHLIQNCCVHLGDLARYESQQELASTFYTAACLVDSTDGHPFNQLGVFSSSDSCLRIDNAITYYIRAISCGKPFDKAHSALDKPVRFISKSTENNFMKFLIGVSLTDNLCVVLLSPLTALFRFCCVILASSNDWVIVNAANEFSASINSLLSIILGVTLPSDLPEAVVERVIKLKTEYSNLEAMEIPVSHHWKLQLRLFNAVVVFAYVLHTNFVNERSLVARQCIVYVITSMINWLVVSVKAIRESDLKVEYHLPLTPLLILILTIKNQLSSLNEKHIALTDEEVFKFAPPLNEETIDFFNTLADSASWAPKLNTNLLKIGLPEIFAIQGFEPVGVPAFYDVFQSGPYEDLFPASFFSEDADLQTLQHRTRIAFLVINLKFVAKNLPSLLKWSNSKKVFEWVQREAPSLPLVDPPISATSVAVAKPLEETKVNGVDKAAEQASAVRVPPKIKANAINTAELARFMDSQQSIISQRLRQKSEEARGAATGSHSYVASRAANNQKGAAPRFSRIHQANSNKNASDQHYPAPMARPIERAPTPRAYEPMLPNGAPLSRPPFGYMPNHPSGNPPRLPPRGWRHPRLQHMHSEGWYPLPPYAYPMPPLPMPYMGVPPYQHLMGNVSYQDPSYYSPQNTANEMNHQNPSGYI